MKFLFVVFERVFYAIILLLAVIILNFLMMHLAPGDVADSIAQTMGGADEEVMNEIRVAYGLDKPFVTQLGVYVWKVAQFDLGYSYFYTQPVTTLILAKVPATLLLVITSQILALIVGVLLGVQSAKNPNGISNFIVSILALFGYAAPVFWTGILLLIAFSLKIQIFPVAGMYNVMVEGNFFIEALDVMKHMVLPVVTLSSIFVALYSRLCRASMMEVLGADFIRTAKAKGLSRNQIIYKHALKNALSPVVTLAGLQLSAVVSGAVLVEAVYSWPGLGTLAFNSILSRDTPTILGILFFSSFVVIIGNLLTDLVLRFIDPRMRNSE